MPEELPLRRSVHQFCRHHGLNRARYLELRNAANVRPLDWDTLLTANDEAALLCQIAANKRHDQVVRHIHDRPTVNKQFVAPSPKPTADYEAQITMATKAAQSWRTTLIELAKGHTEDRNGRCARCRAEYPCPTKRTLHRLDNELVEQIAVADTGDLSEGLEADPLTPAADQARQVRELWAARDRWRILLTDLTIDHMIPDAKGRCAHCPVGVPCDVSKAVKRINWGIAKQIEEYATMLDGELDAALNRRQPRDYDDDWGGTTTSFT